MRFVSVCKVQALTAAYKFLPQFALRHLRTPWLDHFRHGLHSVIRTRLSHARKSTRRLQTVNTLGVRIAPALELHNDRAALCIHRDIYGLRNTYGHHAIPSSVFVHSLPFDIWPRKQRCRCPDRRLVNIATKVRSCVIGFCRKTGHRDQSSQKRVQCPLSDPDTRISSDPPDIFHTKPTGAASTCDACIFM